MTDDKNKYILSINGMSKSFGRNKVLKHISMNVKPGTIMGLMGENGAGKSTLMKMLCGIISTDKGTIKLDGKQVKLHSLIDAQEHKLAIVPQELALVEYFTVAENMFLGREQTKGGFISKQKMFADAATELKKLKIDLDPKMLVGDLSVSQQQMLVIAKVLSLDAETIILDEPTARLGISEIETFLEYMKYLRSLGKTLILISHKLDEIFAVCDDVTVLRDGAVVARHSIADITVDQLIKEMVNRSSQKLEIVKKGTVSDEIVLQVKNLACQSMVKDVSFSLRKGEILGFYGLVGAGRTEAIRAVLGIDKKQSGTIIFKGKPVDFKNIRQSMEAGLVLVPEERRQQGLVLNMSIRNNTTLTKLKDYSKFGFLQEKREIADTEKLRKDLKLACSSIEAQVSSLSGGNQQKVVLSKFIDKPVDVFIVDEPTRGIDVGAKSEIYNLIEDISARGVSVIIISSEIPEIQSICDRVAIMREGEIVKILEPEEFNDAETMLKYSIGG